LSINIQINSLYFSFQYSAALNTIFVPYDKNCLISFKLNIPSEALPLFRIRAKLAFTDPDYVEQLFSQKTSTRY